MNFAYGGAHIIKGDEVVPDFDEQTDAFRHAVDFDADPNALYLITMGGNDIRDLAQTGSNPVPQAEAYAVLDDAADELLQELKQLVEIGAHNIVITGIPDVGLIPRYDRDGNDVLDATEQLRSAAATDYSIYLDTLIRTEVVPALQALGANVIYVPLMDYVDASGNMVTGALSANLPTIAALHGLTTEELSQNLLQYQDLVFFDEVHPNAQANALLGAYMWAFDHRHSVDRNAAADRVGRGLSDDRNHRGAGRGGSVGYLAGGGNDLHARDAGCQLPRHGGKPRRSVTAPARAQRQPHRRELG